MYEGVDIGLEPTPASPEKAVAVKKRKKFARFYFVLDADASAPCRGPLFKEKGIRAQDAMHFAD